MTKRFNYGPGARPYGYAVLAVGAVLSALALALTGGDSVGTVPTDRERLHGPGGTAAPHRDHETSRKGSARVFRIAGNKLKGRSVPKPAERIWDRFAELSPRSSRPHLREFSLVPGASAYVEGASTGSGKWRLAVGRRLNRDRALDHILLHELGHLLTLRRSQTGGRNGCDDELEEIGCPPPASYLGRFVERFWASGDLLEEWEDARDGGRSALQRFYRRHRAAFVSAYAATHPAEDLAETFAVFAGAKLPKGSKVANRKVRSLGSHGKLAKLRKRILKADPKSPRR